MRLLKKINNYEIPFSTSKYDDANEPAWADGTGRDALDGTFVGTKIGNFTKITAQIPMMRESTSRRFRKECEKAIVTLEWYNTTTGSYEVGDFYSSPTKAETYMVVGTTIILNPFIVEFTAIRRKSK